MSDVSGIPNLGIPGMGFSGGVLGGIPNQAPAMSADQINASRWGRFSPQQGQAVLNNIYGPQGFGGATAQAAATGAAYGRATGGFGGRTSAFDTGAAPVPYLSGGGMPFGGGGFGGGTRNSIAQTMANNGPDMSQAVPSLPPSPPAGGRSFIDPPLSTGGLGMPSSQRLLGYDPAASASFAPGGGGDFQGRFGFGFRGAGTPSEYTTSPYTDVSGTTHQPTIPAGYQTPFSADNPGGALGRGGFQGTRAPIMNASDGEDTLTAQDAEIPFGPRGSFDPSAFSPGQYAPGSPFGSGAGVGGTRGGSGGLGTGAGTQMPPTQLPFFGGAGSGFDAPGSTQRGGMYAGSGRYPALVGAPNDAYGNPFIQGNAPPYARGAGQIGGGIGLGGLDALGQGTVYRGIR